MTNCAESTVPLVRGVALYDDSPDTARCVFHSRSFILACNFFQYRLSLQSNLELFFKFPSDHTEQSRIETNVPRAESREKDWFRLDLKQMIIRRSGSLLSVAHKYEYSSRCSTASQRVRSMQ